MKNDHIAAAESYVLSLRDKDLSRVPLAEDVVFKGPLNADELRGASALREFLNGILPIIKDARINFSFSDGEHVCVLWELETVQPAAVIPICEYFRVVDGKLKEVKPFYDPRPITGPGQ
ncbi:MAG: nuclear transport factor 2 family protein [Acidobacteriota bacterium]|nr:MAG: nuclear transport factor 2 family protein [Acidobacteriota bacterium]